MSQTFSLSQMGWNAFFQQQISLEQWQEYQVARVVTQHRSQFEVMTQTSAKLTIPINKAMDDITVGDWLLLDENNKFVQTLTRFSLFSRKSSGSKVALQLIAANVNTVFIVCSLNENFNLNRIERYLAIAKEAEVEPVIVLTKLDCCENPDEYISKIKALDVMLMVEAVNALDRSSVRSLEPWCSTGKTVAFLGSSGVGKSTLINTLLASNEQITAAARADDNRGRHTTTTRSLHLMSAGALLLDTPGMRELQLVDCEKGINNTFIDISNLSMHCQFSNCQHESEPGCAIQAAIASGELETRRLDNFQKLMQEQARNSESLAEKRSKDRNLGRFYRSVISEAKQRKNKQR